MDIGKELKQLDFSKASAAHKARLNKELSENMQTLSESDLTLIAAAGDQPLTWKCAKCGFINSGDADTCSCCKEKEAC